MDKYTLEWVDSRPVRFPRLTYYKNGVSFPRADNKIQVTENEKRRLLMMKNGQRPVFKEVQKRTYSKSVESENSEE